jgi:predicted chitinase
MFLKNVTGKGLTTSIALELTDLGIMRWDSDRSCIVAMFGDSFSFGWGQDWRAPVLACFDTDFNCLGVPVRDGIATRPARQLWEYGHNNPDYSTVLPCDFIRIGSTWFVAVMLTQGLGKETMTEFWQSENLIDWHLTGFGFPHPKSDPCTTMLSFDQFGDDVYVVGTHGLRRDGPVKMWKCSATDFPKGEWLPVNNGDPVLGGRYGELCLRNVQGNAVLSFFDEQNYRQSALCVAHPEDDWGSGNRLDYVSGQELPQLYGGYISPDSKLDEPNGMKFWVSQWLTAGNAAYHVVAYSGTLPAMGQVVEQKQSEREIAVSDPVSVLSEVMGGSLSRDRYAALLPAVSRCLRECDCTTVNRIAMWCAQIGHESGGLQWMQEIADGSAYEGRQDLGNTQQGDGRRFKGHGPIQVTGRRNHQVCSEWAYGKGLVPSPTYFVDNPDQLASDTYGFIGVAWYWTTQRPLNEASDAGDIDQATRYINGGLNGIADRRDRYNRALGMGDRLLELGTVVDTTIVEKVVNVTEKVLEYDHSQQRVAQEKFWDCGPASTQIVLQGAGVDMSEDQLIRELGTTTDGTNTVEQALPVLNRVTDGQYKAVWMPHDPPSQREEETLWNNIKGSIDAGFGCVLNFEVPSSNFPRGTRGSVSPQYRGHKIWHYVACMGYADDGPGGKHVWIADPGFQPFGYWMSLHQAATAIPPHAYAYASVQAAQEHPVLAPVSHVEAPEQRSGVSSRSAYRTPGEGPLGPLESVQLNDDALLHQLWVEWSAVTVGDVDAVYRVVRSAAGHGADTSPEFIQRAKLVLGKVDQPVLARVLDKIQQVEPALLEALVK